MATAKDIFIKPIKASAANAIVKKIHYSGKVVSNSSLHFGVFLNGRLEGAMQFGSPMDKRKSLALVKGTLWSEMIELNRMAFSDDLPRFSESRAIGYALREIKKNYPHIKWVQSFSDATACGDGTIYRASGFYLTSIKENSSIYEFPDGKRIAVMSLTNSGDQKGRKKCCEKYGAKYDSSSSMKPFIDIGAKKADGNMLRYIYFLHKECKEMLAVPLIDFSEIDKSGAGMYKGKKVTLKSRRSKQATIGDHSISGGAAPTTTLHYSSKQ